jgi:hypothetical protein
VVLEGNLEIPHGTLFLDTSSILRMYGSFEAWAEGAGDTRIVLSALGAATIHVG